jgi:hypothetical protein
MEGEMTSSSPRAYNGIEFNISIMTGLVIFEAFTAVAMKNGVLWDVTPCGSCKN